MLEFMIKMDDTRGRNVSAVLVENDSETTLDTCPLPPLEGNDTTFSVIHWTLAQNFIDRSYKFKHLSWSSLRFGVFALFHHFQV